MLLPWHYFGIRTLLMLTTLATGMSTILLDGILTLYNPNLLTFVHIVCYFFYSKEVALRMCEYEQSLHSLAFPFESEHTTCGR